MINIFDNIYILINYLSNKNKMYKYDYESMYCVW